MSGSHAQWICGKTPDLVMTDFYTRRLESFPLSCQQPATHFLGCASAQILLQENFHIMIEASL